MHIIRIIHAGFFRILSLKGMLLLLRSYALIPDGRECRFTAINKKPRLKHGVLKNDLGLLKVLQMLIF